MSKRSVPRSSQSGSAVSRVIVPRPADPRQPELFEARAPGYIQPCLATLTDRAPSSARWQHEIKHDGFRAQIHLQGDAVRIFTRGGHDWASRFPSITAGIRMLGTRSIILDGEAVMVGSDGVTDFWALHRNAFAGSAPAAFLYAFDLLWLDGEDLRPLPLEVRRERLQEVLRHGVSEAIHFSEDLAGDGPTILAHACRLGLEGIISKKRGSAYRSGRRDEWRKAKCSSTEAFVAIEHGRGDWGFTVRVARLADGRLQPVGWVGTGYTAESARGIRRALDEKRPVIIEVEHRGWTPSGDLRHPSAKGWHQG